jgi:predicted DNA-binding ribbon-helix-helix protein
MSRGCDLGERGELMAGMLRSAVREDMFWWEVSDLKMARERKGEVGGDRI